MLRVIKWAKEALVTKTVGWWHGDVLKAMPWLGKAISEGVREGLSECHRQPVSGTHSADKDELTV